jgi:hypothetical protein
MSDVAVKFSAGGTPTQETVPTSTAEGQPEKPLSAAEIRQIIQEETLKAMDIAKRQSMSAQAKSEARIKQMVNDQLATLKAAGVQVGTQEAQAIESTIRSQASQAETPPDVPGEQAGEETDSEDPRAINMAAEAMMRATGVFVNDDDPEAKLLDMSNGQAFLASLNKAIAAKQTRTTTSPEARMPAGGGKGAQVTSVVRELDQLLQHPTAANLPRIRELRAMLNK